MKWLIVVLMMGAHADGAKDTYLYLEPHVETVDDCKDYVYFNAGNIKNHMQMEFDGNVPEMIYCMTEKKVKEFIDFGKPGLDA